MYCNNDEKLARKFVLQIYDLECVQHKKVKCQLLNQRNNIASKT